MFARLASKLEALFVESATRRHGAQLSCAWELGDSQHRSRFLEASHNPYGFRCADKSGDMRI